jgi:hypothetical protein
MARKSSARAVDPWPWIRAVRGFFLARRRQWAIFLDARLSLVPIALGVALLLLPQGQDVVRDLAEGANLYLRSGEPWSAAAWWSYFRWACFLAACVWSGVIAWYWPNLIAHARDAHQPRWFILLRRMLGLTPLVAGAAAIAVTGDGGLANIWIALLLFAAAAVALLLFFGIRRKLAEGRFADSWLVRPARWLNRLAARLGARTPNLTNGDALFMILTFWLSLLVLLLFTIAGVRTHLAWSVGSAAIAFGAIGSIIAVVSGTAWLVSGVRLPVITTGVLALILFSCTNDNHQIDAIGGNWRRPSVRDAYLRWADVNREGPIVLVATSGGASRAAYWTAAVLRALDDRTDGRFGRQVFAISSVSGGSLGAVGFAGWHADHPVGQGGCTYSREARLEFDRAFFGADYLSPALAGLLYPDLAQRFVPFGVFPDRAAALEEAWVQGWRDAADADADACAPADRTSDRLRDDFMGIWNGVLEGDLRAPRWVPIVLLNGTAVETGKRVITAPVTVDPGIFEDSHDFFELFGRRVRAATAVTNSARFPLVSPAGTVPLPGGGVMRIVDGGYLENGGIETIYDLARYLRTIDSTRPILIIEITNDDVVVADASIRNDLARYSNGLTPNESIAERLPVSPPVSSGFAVASGPGAIIQAFYRTRTARGVLAAKRLSAAQAAGLGPSTYRASFHLGPLIPGRRTAMSWSLSRSSRARMDSALEMERVIRSDPEMSVERVERDENLRSADLNCQRVAVDQIASAIDGRVRRPRARCVAGSESARWTGVPLFPEAPRPSGPAAR